MTSPALHLAEPELSAPILDIHATLNGFGLSLVWYCPTCGLETRRRFVREYSTLSLAARAAALEPPTTQTAPPRAA